MLLSWPPCWPLPTVPRTKVSVVRCAMSLRRRHPSAECTTVCATPNSYTYFHSRLPGPGRCSSGPCSTCCTVQRQCGQRRRSVLLGRWWIPWLRWLLRLVRQRCLAVVRWWIRRIRRFGRQRRRSVLLGRFRIPRLRWIQRLGCQCRRSVLQRLSDEPDAFNFPHPLRTRDRSQMGAEQQHLQRSKEMNKKAHKRISTSTHGTPLTAGITF